jgi:hypothetical protein
MNEPENAGVAARTMHGVDEPASWQALHEELRRLRLLLNTTLLAMLLLSVAVNAFLFHQDRTVQTQLNEARRMVQEFQTVKWPLVNKLVTNLQSFAQVHSDLNPILEKYGIKPAAPIQVSPPAPAPLPSAGRTGK